MKDKLIFLVSGLLIGLGCTAFFYNFKYVQELHAAKNSTAKPDSFYEKIATRGQAGSERHSSPWQEFEEMKNHFFSEQGMDSLISDEEFESFFKSAHSQQPIWNQNSQPFTILKKETNSELSYEIELQGSVQGDSVEVKVENNNVIISGQQKQSSENKSDQSQTTFFSTMSFTRSFSLPPGVDSEHMEIKNQGKSITLKFPKI